MHGNYGRKHTLPSLKILICADWFGRETCHGVNRSISMVRDTSDEGRWKCGDVEVAGKSFGDGENPNALRRRNASREHPGKRERRLDSSCNSKLDNIVTNPDVEVPTKFFSGSIMKTNLMGRQNVRAQGIEDIATLLFRRRIQLIIKHSANSGEARKEPKIRRTAI